MFLFLSFRKNEFKPFENASNIEFLSKKNDCAHFMFASHTKKRPNNIIMGSIYDSQILDMFEVGIENFKPMSDFKNSKITFQCKPILVFSGDQFEEEFQYRRIKTFLIDFFVGHKTNAVALNGLEHCIQVVAYEGKIYFRSYRIMLKKTGTKYYKVETEEIGPRFDMTLRRTKLASDDLYKKSFKQPTQSKPKKIKNINVNKLGTRLGRIHMNRQDYQRLQTRKMKGLKKDGSKKKQDKKEQANSEHMEVDLNTNNNDDGWITVNRKKHKNKLDSNSTQTKKVKFYEKHLLND